MPRDRRKVAFVITSLVGGGAQKQLAEVATRLGERGWKVVGIISLTPGGDWQTTLEARGLEVYSLGMRSPLSAPAALARATRLMRGLAPDVVVGFLFHGTMLGAVAARMAGVPMVVASIRSERMGGRWREWAFARAAGLWDVALVNSRSVGDSLVRRGILHVDGWDVIPNGIDPLSIGDRELAGRDALGVDDSDFLWLAVGSLLPAKDYPTLLAALAELEGGRWQVLVAGEGPLAGALREMAVQLGLVDRIRFLGDRSDVPDLLRMADGFVNSSQWEGSPNAVLEAMLVGLPVVATRVGGTPDLFPTPEVGVLVPPNSPERLAQAMARIMKLSKGERVRMGQASRQAVLSNHTWDQVVTGWERALTVSHTRGGRASVRTEAVAGPSPHPDECPSSQQDHGDQNGD